MTVNRVTLIGNLGADPEVKTTSGGNTVANLRIATTERRKDRDGNWTDHTEWHSVVVWGKQAENVGKYLTKGRQVYIEGRLQTRKWQDSDGKDRWSTEVNAFDVKFLSGGKDDGGQRGGNSGNRSQGQSQQRSTGRQDQGPPPGDDDIPF